MRKKNVKSAETTNIVIFENREKEDQIMLKYKN
jgi:hypothetical protein